MYKEYYTPYCYGCSMLDSQHQYIGPTKVIHDTSRPNEIDLLILGDFPLKADNQSPLNAAALKDLRLILAKNKMNYILANIVSCKKLSGEFKIGDYAKICSKNITQELINLNKPKVILALGRIAAGYVGVHGPITQIVSKVVDNNFGRVIVNFHPREIYKDTTYMELFKYINENIIDLINSESKIKFKVVIPRTTSEALKEINKLKQLPKGTKVAFDIETLLFDWSSKAMNLDGVNPYSEDNDVLTISFAYREPNTEEIKGVVFLLDIFPYLNKLSEKYSVKINILKEALNRFKIDSKDFLNQILKGKVLKEILSYKEIARYLSIKLFNKDYSDRINLYKITKKDLINAGIKDITVKEINTKRKEVLEDDDKFHKMVLDLIGGDYTKNIPSKIAEKYNITNAAWKLVISNLESNNYLYNQIKNTEREIQDSYKAYDFKKIEKEILDLLETNEHLDLVAHNVKFELKHFLARKGIDIKNITYDTQLLRYQLKEDQKGFYSLKKLVSLYLPNYSNYEDSKKDLISLLKYNALDSIFTLHIAKELYKEIKKTRQDSLLGVHKKILIPATKAFSEIELNGIKVDLELMQEYKETIEELLKFYIGKMNNIANTYGIQEIEPTVSDQIAFMVYNILGAPPQYTETNKLKTDEDSMFMALDYFKKSGNKEGIEFTTWYYSFLKLYKQYTTYIIGYLGVKNEIVSNAKQLESKVNMKTGGRIHAEYSFTGTVTGRLSSSNPNFQQIPRVPINICLDCLTVTKGKCTLCGSKGIPVFSIKSFFIPEEGSKLLAFDYSQLEVRVLAIASGDNEMLSAIKNGLDMHSFVASKIYGYNYDFFFKKAKKEHNKEFEEMRSIAKKATFGVAYGSTAYNMSLELGIAVEEAQSIIDSFYESFPKVKEYIKGLHYSALRNGYVKSIVGRYRHFIVDLNDRKMVARVKRQAQNFPIQSAGNDIGLVATYMLVNKLKKYDSKVVGYVHDSIEIEADKRHVDTVIKETKNIMEYGVREVHKWLGDLPLAPDLEFVEDGNRWAEEPGNLNKIKGRLQDVKRERHVSIV